MNENNGMVGSFYDKTRIAGDTMVAIWSREPGRVFSLAAMKRETGVSGKTIVNYLRATERMPMVVKKGYILAQHAEMNDALYHANWASRSIAVAGRNITKTGNMVSSLVVQNDMDPEVAQALVEEPSRVLEAVGRNAARMRKNLALVSQTRLQLEE